MTAFDLITMGRVGVDIYPEQVGVGLEDVQTFAKFLGGSSTNVAVAASRLGHRAATITRTGNDPFGRFVNQALRGYGVDDRWVTPVDGLQTPVVFCEIFPPDDFPLYFYRGPKAPDLHISVDELDFDAIRAAEIFWVTVTGLSQEPSREAHLAALEARSGSAGSRGRTTILDLDYRPMFWDSPELATAEIAKALPHVTVAVGNKEECHVAIGETEPEAAAKALIDAGVELAVVKQGPLGVLGVRGNESVVVPPVPVDVVNGLHQRDLFGCFAQRSHNLVVAAMPHQHDRVAELAQGLAEVGGAGLEVEGQCLDREREEVDPTSWRVGVLPPARICVMISVSSSTASEVKR